MNECKKRDCHYCNFGFCADATSDCDCYADSGFFDHHVEDTKKEAEECPIFEYCDGFPKF